LDENIEISDRLRTSWNPNKPSAWKTKLEQIFGFSGELSRGLPKVVRRFVVEMMFGIQARGSVRLTEVGRALGEKISFKKTEERLCRQLGRPWLEEAISRRIIHLAAPRIHEDTLMMLTDLEVRRSRKSLWHVISYYLLRWRIEESIRFHKQSYDLEDIRLLTYTRLQNMMALVTAAAFCLEKLGLTFRPELRDS